MESDNDQLLNMLNVIDKNITKINFFRHCNPNLIIPDKPRPMNVILYNAIEVFKILRSQSILRTSSQWTNIRIAPIVLQCHKIK